MSVCVWVKGTKTRHWQLSCKTQVGETVLFMCVSLFLSPVYYMKVSVAFHSSFHWLQYWPVIVVSNHGCLLERYSFMIVLFSHMWSFIWGGIVSVNGGEWKSHLLLVLCHSVGSLKMYRCLTVARQQVERTQYEDLLNNWKCVKTYTNNFMDSGGVSSTNHFLG